MKLAVHTIFNLRENILFMEEWIAYHKLIGFERFYLYDNSKSNRTDGRTNSLNKYQMDFAKATRHIDNNELVEKIESIVHKFRKEIVYIMWEPKDEFGNIVYSQSKSITHYIDHFFDHADWTAFIDMDEYIYCKIDLKETIGNIISTHEVDNLILFQKKFDDRFNNIDKPVISIEECIEGIDTTLWAPKNLCNNKALKENNKNTNWDIHDMLSANGKFYCCPFEDFRFNHYNVNNYQLDWMRSYYGMEKSFEFNGRCRALSQRAKFLEGIPKKLFNSDQ